MGALRICKLNWCSEINLVACIYGDLACRYYAITPCRKYFTLNLAPYKFYLHAKSSNATVASSTSSSTNNYVIDIMASDSKIVFAKIIMNYKKPLSYDNIIMSIRLYNYFTTFCMTTHSYELMLNCWQLSPDQRPSPDDLIAFLCKDDESVSTTPISLHSPTFFCPVRN